MKSLGKADIVCTGAEEAAPAAIDLELLTDKLNQICRSASLGLALRVGELVINSLYGGSLEQWSRSGTSRPSYRALAARSDLEISASALCRSISIYALVQRLGGTARWHYIGASHFQEVLALPAAEQDGLLTTADEQRWSVARLRAATKTPSDESQKTERAEVVRSIRRQGALLAKHLTLLLSDEVEDLDCSAIEDLQHRLRDVLEKLGPAADVRCPNEAPHPKSDITELAPQTSAAPKRTA